jgi:nucleoside-diphosphate-sugar epimerase
MRDYRRQLMNNLSRESQVTTVDPALRLPWPVLITGANGFIASHLAERLLREGCQVRGTVRRPGATDWLTVQGMDVVQADLEDQESLTRAARGCGVLVHAAAWTGGPGLSAGQAWRSNVDGTANALAAAAAAGVERFVYLSSVAVYGLNRAPVIDESAATPPVGQLYPDSKIAAEGLVRGSGLSHVIVRPASTYGPRGTAWTVGPVEAIRRNRLILLGKDDGLVTPGYVDNVIDGLLLTLVHPAAAGGTFNLCDNRAVTFREFYLAYARMLGRESLPALPTGFARLARTRPANLARRLAGRQVVGPWSLHFRLNPSRFSVERAMHVLGYVPQIGFVEGMRRTEKWLRSAGYL